MKNNSNKKVSAPNAEMPVASESQEFNKSNDSISDDQVTPSKEKTEESPSKKENIESGPDSAQKSNSKFRYKGKGVDSKGRPRNFYNPPGKVLRHLAQ